MLYDYIVVGAGAAGAVLAARLTEDPSVHVLLLEAGPDWRAHEMPAAMRSPNPFNIILPKQYQARFMWPTLMAQRTKAQAPRILWRGKGLGGSTAVNGQIAIRGVADCFDRWALQGCSRWAWADVLPAFQKLEDDEEFGDAPYHGRGGPIPIYRASQDKWGPVDRALRDAARDLGYGWCDDLNAPNAIGVTPYAIHSRDGIRVTTNDAYLEPARMRNNLFIAGDALVDRVMLDDMRASGVRVRIGDSWQVVEAREIILSAGAFHSPSILMRSGIGPAQHLKELGINVLSELPVGDHLFDHPFVRIELKLRSDLKPMDRNARHTNCCVKYSSGHINGTFCDMLIMAFNHGGVGEELDRTMFGEAGIHVSVFDSFSRGTVRISNTDPDVQPTVDLNMLSDRRDLERLRDGARKLFKIGNHAAIQAITTSVTVGNTGRSISSVADAPDQEIDTWLLADCSEAQHGAGSCRMSPTATGPEAGVVDPSCRVHGVRGLRVADASIMPSDCKANTALTSIMIGEHFASMLLNERRSTAGGRH